MSTNRRYAVLITISMFTFLPGNCFPVQNPTNSDPTIPLAFMKWRDDGPPSGFDDGDLAKINEFIVRMKETDTKPTPVNAVDAEINRLRDPLAAIQLEWQTSGDIRFSNTTSGKSWLELRHTSSKDTFIGTPMVFPLHYQNLEFDLNVQHSSANDTLDVSYKGQVFHSINLAEMPASNHISIPLTGSLSTHTFPTDHPSRESIQTQIADSLLTFRLRGPDTSPIVVQLTNFKITLAPVAIPTKQNNAH